MKEDQIPLSQGTKIIAAMLGMLIFVLGCIGAASLIKDEFSAGTLAWTILCIGAGADLLAAGFTNYKPVTFFFWT